MLRYLLRRLVFVAPQLVGILAVGFFLVKLIPGDPAILMLGPNATQDAVDSLREQLGLRKPVGVQFLLYLWRVAHGDLGMSWQTTRPVMEDLLERFPATLELVTLSLALALLVGVPLGVQASLRAKGPLRRVSDGFGLIAGAVPDFWLALTLVFIFYSVLHWAPAPMGRLDVALSAPDPVTGSLLIDTLIAGDWRAFGSAAAHLALPVLTLAIVNAGPVLKMTQSTMDRVLASDFVRYATMCGLPPKVIQRQAMRAALPSIITVVSILFTFAIGGAVLVEIVFSWGGAGQYAVQGVLNADINPVLGFVLFSATLTLLLYLIVDLLYFALDPRTRS